jgi:hypothetical protein
MQLQRVLVTVCKWWMKRLGPSVGLSPVLSMASWGLGMRVTLAKLLFG